MTITTKFQPGNVVRTPDHMTLGTIRWIEVFAADRYIYCVVFYPESAEPTYKTYKESELELVSWS